MGERNVSEVALPDSPSAGRLTLSCPAKLNLRLAVTGRRPDGYHNLISLVSAITLADTLEIEFAQGQNEDVLIVDGPIALPDATDNLVLAAIRAFRKASGIEARYTVRLTKRIPFGAGLGGGSSDAAGTLRALQQIWHQPLETAALHHLAAKLGADVPLFLGEFPAIMRGLGEELEPVPAWREALAPLRVAVFQPPFGISTPWAYRALAQREAYVDAAAEESRYAQWFAHGLDWQTLPANSFRTVADARYPTLPVLLEVLNALPGIRAEMTGSGSACFAMGRGDADLDAVEEIVRDAWSDAVFFVRSRFM